MNTFPSDQLDDDHLEKLSIITPLSVQWSLREMSNDHLDSDHWTLTEVIIDH